MITLTRDDTEAVITLGKDLIWVDEHLWSTLVDVPERTVTGALVVETWTMVAGRPISLESDGEDFGLLTRSTVEALRVWEAVPGLEMTLAYHGQSIAVMFRRIDRPAIEARPIHSAGAPQAADLMSVRIHLREL
jgi:hypothetical protein